MKRRMMFMLGVVMTVIVGLGWMPSAMAASTNICDDATITEDKKALAGCSATDKDKTVMPLAVTLIKTAMSVTGVLAVGVIVYGGVTYTTSNGDASKANKAKNILIYGLAGLLVSMLAWAIVQFVSVSIFG